MILEKHDIESPLWHKLKTHYDVEIAKYRARLENPRIQEVERVELCWKIEAIKRFFALAEPERGKETGAE